MHKAVFIGFKPLIDSIDLDEGGQLVVIHGADLDQAVAAIGSSQPLFVVVSSAAADQGSGTILERIVERIPDFRLPVITVETGSEPQPLTIYEWRESSAEPEARSVPHEHLRHEMSRLCAAAERRQTATESIRDIGYYDYVEQGGEFFHIQTEIIPKQNPVIQTTILKGGTIVDSNAEPIPENAGNAASLAAIAKAQHNRALGNVTDGKYN
jgi:hypothetical protein